MRYAIMKIPAPYIQPFRTILSAAGFKDEDINVPIQAQPEQSEASVAWTPIALERMYRESAGPMRNVFKLFVSRPGQVILVPDLRAAIGGGGAFTVPGMFGAFGRRLKNRYRGMPWPIEATYNHLLQRHEYKMPLDIAQRLGPVIIDVEESAKGKPGFLERS